MTMTWSTRLSAVVLALLLADCSRSPPAPPPPEPAPPPPPPVVHRPVRQTLRTHWNFNTTANECTAVATAGRESLQVSVRRDAPIRLTIALSADARPRPGTRMHFVGAAGDWQIIAQPAGARKLTAALGSDDIALGRVLVLLSGGVLEIGDLDQTIASLAMPPSEAPGQHWFDCARSGTG